MKKIFITALILLSTVTFANEKIIKIVKSKTDATCTVTVTIKLNSGETYTGTATASTCAKAEKMALADALN